MSNQDIYNFKILFIWNDNDYAKFALSSSFGVNSFISLFKKFQDVIKNQQEFDSIVILAELSLDGKKLCDFYGFEILCQLRAEHRLKCPIAVCSFMPEAWLRKKFPILEFPQHHPFIQLPASPETFIERVQKAEIADEPRLNDIIVSYCNPKGRLIRLLTHGEGFRQITKNIQINNADDSFWFACKDDLSLLRTYLVNKAFGETVLSLGSTLAEKLEEAINKKNISILISIKSLFELLIDELVKLKDS